MQTTHPGIVFTDFTAYCINFFGFFVNSINTPFYTINMELLQITIIWQAIILFTGGLFLIYKSTSEIQEKLETPEHDEDQMKHKKIKSVTQAVIQILIIDFIFS